MRVSVSLVQGIDLAGRVPSVNFRLRRALLHSLRTLTLTCFPPQPRTIGSSTVRTEVRYTRLAS